MDSEEGQVQPRKNPSGLEEFRKDFLEGSEAGVESYKETLQHDIYVSGIQR